MPRGGEVEKVASILTWHQMQHSDLVVCSERGDVSGDEGACRWLP